MVRRIEAAEAPTYTYVSTPRVDSAAHDYGASVYISLKDGSPEAYSAHAALLKEIIDSAQ